MKSSKFLIIFMFLCINRVFAGIGVDPVIIETLVRPGKTQKRVFTVVNNENRPITVQVVLENWLKRKGYRNELSNLKPEEWLKIKPNKFEMKPNSKRKIKYYIKIPKGLKGELVAMAFFSSEKKKGSFIQQRLGACIYAGIKGTEEINCEILNTKVINNKEKLKFAVKVKNTGNVHIRPDGSVIIMQKKNFIKEVKFHKGLSIFPGKTHHIYTESADLPTGDYTAETVIKYGDIFGKSKSLKGEVIEFIIPLPEKEKIVVK